jgi:hypothetical protein
MRRMWLILITMALAANGLAMLGWPEQWYYAVPTVPYTGPFNAHFVRDIGCAYLTVAGGLLWFTAQPDRARPAALTGIAFLLAHAAVHLWDTAAGRCSVGHLAQDFVGVLLVPLVALRLVLKSPLRAVSTPVLN